jgi:pyruvate dehydrogenase E1 component alpha subunit
MFDPELYRDKEEVERWKDRDPIALFGATLVAEGAVTQEDIEAFWTSAREETDDAVEYAEAADYEPVATLTKHVYAEKAGAEG